MQAVYHGYARLDSGVTGTFYSQYYFSQNASNTVRILDNTHPVEVIETPPKLTYIFFQATTRHSISGPEYQNGQVYTKVDNVESAAVVWSPCGVRYASIITLFAPFRSFSLKTEKLTQAQADGILNVNNRVALTSSSSSAAGEISNDDATIALTQQINVQWRRC
jgi:hypothetical protein